MDPHLNLFYSYQKGDDDKENQKRLEDNLTRAFLATLVQLKKDDADVPDTDKIGDFLTRLLGLDSKEIHPQDVSFGIQNLKIEELKKAQNAKKKIILTIGGSPFKRESFYRILDESKDEIYCFEKLPKKKRKEKLTEIRYSQKKLKIAAGEENDCRVGGEFEEISELAAPLGLFHECRPDGWIYSKHFAVLIESKIGNAPQSEHQIFRHLWDDRGFALKLDNITDTFEELHIHKTWEEIGEKLKSVAPENLVVKEFYRFLILVGEIMSLNEIIESEYDEEVMRKQFPLFLKNLDKKIKQIDDRLIRGERPKENLWDYYGPGKDANGNVWKNPHYSIYFNSQDVGIALTISDGKNRQMEKLLKSEKLIDYLSKIAEKTDDQFSKQRIILRLQNYRIVDHIKGQQRGARQNTFDFEFVLSEILEKKNRRKVLENMAECACFAKQLDIGYRLLLPSPEKNPREGGLLEANVNLLKIPNSLVALYSNFVSETKDLFDLIKNTK